VYPLALTLPRIGGQRQFLITAGAEDVSAGSAGTFYVVGDGSVVTATPDGLVASAGLGETTVTIIHGPAETLVPVVVVEPLVGSATIGAEGGLVQSAEGTVVQIAPGALPAGSTVSLTTVPDTIEPAFDEVWEVGTTFELDLSGAELSEPAQVMVPVGPGFSAGDTVYFFKKEALTLADGSTQDIWLLLETGEVGSDGLARTTSPPYPGFSAGGQYRLAKADTPDKLVSVGFGAPPHVGYSIAFTPYGYGIPIGPFLPLPFTLSVSISFLVYAGNPRRDPVCGAEPDVRTAAAGIRRNGPPGRSAGARPRPGQAGD
jgi:hypothetical protein